MDIRDVVFRVVTQGRKLLVYTVIPILLMVTLGSPTVLMDASRIVLCFLSVPFLIVAFVAGSSAIERKRDLGWRDDVAVVSTILAVVVMTFDPMSGHGSHSYTVAKRESSQLRNVALGLRGYYNAHGHFPPPVVRDKTGRPLYSWRVLILPYVDEQELFEAFHKDEPWDSPHNRPLLDRVPGAYIEPGGAPDPRQTRVGVLVGPGAAFEDGEMLDEGDFRDHPDTTILLARSTTPVFWSQPGDIDARWPGVLKQLAASGNGWIGVATSRAMTQSIEVNDPRLRAMLTRSGGEAISED